MRDRFPSVLYMPVELAHTAPLLQMETGATSLRRHFSTRQENRRRCLCAFRPWPARGEALTWQEMFTGLLLDCECLSIPGRCPTKLARQGLTDMI